MHLGKNKTANILAVFLLLSASAGGQAGKSYKYRLNGDLQIKTAITENRSIIINYSAPELNVENVTNEYGTFYRINIPGHIRTVDPGKPELPVYSKLITIPDGSVCNVRISEVKSSRIKPSGMRIDGMLYPAQEGETKEIQQKRPVFLKDKTTYASRGIIESDTVIIEPVGKVRNTNLANLIISPVRYNPRTNTLEVITSMKIEISYTYKNSPASKSLLPQTALFNESLSKGVINYNPGDVVPGFTDQPAGMIIITDTAFRKQLEPFFKWKTQKGYNLSVLYKGTGLAGDTYTELKDTITKIYNESSLTNNPPEYLLIIGDVSRVPYYGAGGTGNVTDMYYGEFDGNGDYMPEMYVGRLPVSDTTELKSVVKKIIQYEKFQFADTNKFYSGAIGAAGSDAGYASYMNGQLKYLATNYLTPQNSINESHFYYPSVLTTEKDSIIKLINKGTSLINYSGHGDLSGWLHVNIKVADTALMKNNNMYPLIISNACQTAKFNTRYSFGNQMVVSGKKGAIGLIGCSNDSYWDEDYYWAVGIGTISSDPTYEGTGPGAFDRLFHTHSEAPSEWFYTLGQINYAGNLSVSASTSSRKKYYWETYNVVGDPSVIPIIGKPKSFNISLPDTLPNGIKSLSLNIEPFAYIAVSHFDKLWDASFASASGSVSLEMPGLSNDSCLIVITGQNRYPVIKTVYFSEINKEFLNLTSASINDSQGNNNLKADFGESVFLKLTIGNLGMTNATGVYAKITSTSDWLSITSDSAFIGTLSAKSEITLSDILGVKIKDNVPDKGVATIKLLLKDDKTEKSYTIDVLIHAPELDIINLILEDTDLGNGDHIADPGETLNLIFRVNNTGSSNISGQFSISSNTTDISILEQTKSSGLLQFGGTTEIPVMVKISETAPSGSYIPISSILDCTPYIVNEDFSFRVGKVRESFEAESFNVFPWINTSSKPWIITNGNSADGIVSAQSGAITHNGKTTLKIKTIYAKPDSLKFSYKVSSEPGYDYLSFKLNGTEILKKSGEIPWTRKAVYVPAGYNQMEWIFAMDNSTLGGSNCAWIDLIDFTVSGAVSYINKDLQVAKMSAPVQKDKFGQETITVKVLNAGKDIINGFNLAYSINDKLPPVNQLFPDIVYPNGDTVTVSFKVKADLSKYGLYNIASYSLNNNDDYLGNDTAYVKVENSIISESLSVYPNPFKDQITVYLNAPASEIVRISIISVSGIELFSTERSVLKGNNTIPITDARLIPSLYYLNVRGATLNKTVPVLRIE